MSIRSQLESFANPTAGLGLLALLSTLFLSGCASLNKEECLNAEWYTIGFEDGARGVARGRLGDHRKACAEYGVRPQPEEYLRGHDDGLVRFCTPANGYRAGTAGRSIAVTCPAGLSSGFDDAYRYGYRIHVAEKELRSHDRSLKAKRTELDELRAQIAAVEQRLVGTGEQARQQALRLKRARGLIRREAELEREIAALERERNRHREGGRQGKANGRESGNAPGRGDGHQDNGRGNGHGRDPDGHARGSGKGKEQGQGRVDGHPPGREQGNAQSRGQGNGQARGPERDGGKHNGGAARTVLTGSAQGKNGANPGQDKDRILKQRYEQMISGRDVQDSGAEPERKRADAGRRNSNGHVDRRHQEKVLAKKHRELEQVRHSLATLEREMDEQSTSRHERLELLRQSKRLSREERYLEADIYDMEVDGERLRDTIHGLRARAPY